mmetsp:Transcript_17613/g.27190  ORF Transcript_17613/g.27190 Transcript_17613/m.27190 type:complete len:655 (+) Transcript_17613:121-2085(+)|eukprot:CAMPEP_0195304902 /NCGR_PEP_ID=MMETSP0707-20130614/35333_1 /TAXON_ID=33640 /ORGANISM="Asterionellopsis glacialis, Strain CCMP134" /LENGTH=654 /DNA_ID=CAMNT_0040368873 /DNA_START=96 /DNA_END=2060 /DNA_ORIENTATION=+
MAEKTSNDAIRDACDATTIDKSNVRACGTETSSNQVRAPDPKDGSWDEKNKSEHSFHEESEAEEMVGSDGEVTADSKQSHTSADEKQTNENGDRILVIPARFTRSGRKKAIPFPLKLMRVLSIKEYDGVIKWLPAGKSWVIVDTKAFSKRVLPIHFKEAKYSSFTRKLHRWGFQRHLRGEETGAFFHKDFRRGRMDLCEQMSCYKPRPPKMQLPNHPPRGGLPIQAATPNTTSQMQFSAAAPVVPFMNQNPSNYSHVPSHPPLQMAFPPQPLAPRGAEMGDAATRNITTGTTTTRPADRDTIQSSNDVNTWDIAIELEVTRRLRESIQNASGSPSTGPRQTRQLPHASQPVPFVPTESHLDVANPRDVDLTVPMQTRYTSERISMPVDYPMRNSTMNSMGVPVPALQPPSMGVGYVENRGKLSTGLTGPPGTSQHPNAQVEDRIQEMIAIREGAMKQNVAMLEAERLAALQKDAAQLGADRRGGNMQQDVAILEAERRALLQQETARLATDRRGGNIQQDRAMLEAKRLAALQQDAAQLAADRREGDMVRLEAERRALLQQDAAKLGAERRVAMQQQERLQMMEAERRAAMQQSISTGSDTRNVIQEVQAAETRMAIQAAQIQDREDCIRREMVRRSQGLHSLPHSHFDGAKSA